MKFVSAVTALVAAMAVGSEAAKPKKVSRRELNQRMKNGQFDEKTLLAGAKPNNEAAKKRALGNNQEYYFTGDHSIQFKSCFSLTTSYADMFEGDEGSTVMALFSQGQLLALESYAIFTVYYTTAGTAEEYVVSLDTYLESLVNYLPNQVEEYCEACKENFETCQQQLYGQYGYNANNANVNYNANANNYNGNNVNNVNYNYGGRQLLEVERVLENNQVVRQLDCGLCQQYGCVDFSSDDEQGGEENDNGFASAAEWLEEIATCKETGIAYQGGYNNGGGYYYNQQQGEEAEGEGLFAGMICNGDGTGVEIGLFYDDECKLYLPNESFKNYMSYYDQTYLEMTKEVIEFTFSDNVFSCKEQEIVYTTQNVGDYANQYYGNYDWNQNADADDIAEWCEGILQADGYIVDMRTCGNGQNNGYYYSKYNYGSYDDDEVVAQMSSYEWYRFEISEDDAEDMGTVCGVARRDSMHSFYNTNNGNLYSYGSSSSADVDFLDSSIKSGPSAGAVFGWIIVIGLAAGSGVALYMKYQADSKEDKNVALIDPEEVEQKGGEVA